MSDFGISRTRLKQSIIQWLQLDGITPQDIADEEPLFRDGLGLDSVDALEILLGIEKEYGIRLEDEDLVREVLVSVASIATYLEQEAKKSS